MQVYESSRNPNFDPFAMEAYFSQKALLHTHGHAHAHAHRDIFSCKLSWEVYTSSVGSMYHLRITLCQWIHLKILSAALDWIYHSNNIPCCTFKGTNYFL